MILQAKNIKEYKQASQILYVLDAIRKYGNGIVSKISLQKIIYLSVLLSPIKDVILNFLRYQYNYRGPWNPDIQNIIDHLVGQDYVLIESYVAKSDTISYVNYQITDKGIVTVKSLMLNKNEEERNWWITIVSRLAIKYSSEEFESEWKGLDRIVSLVYQDPTFLEGKTLESYRDPISFDNRLNATNQLIDFAKQYISNSKIQITKQNERTIAEVLIIAFFEYLMVRILNDEYTSGKIENS